MTTCLNGCLEFESRCKKCNRLLCSANVGPQWIDLKDKFPEKEKHVLVCFMDVTTPKICVASYDGLGWNHWPIGSFAGDGCIFDVTYWMPLPEPPEIN